MTQKRIIVWIVALLAGTAVAMAIGVYRVGQAHQQAAIEFWGDDYDPSESGARVDWGFFGNIVMPSGGPMIAPEIAGVCLDTPLPLVPIKVNAAGKGQVLCGLGSESMVMGFDVERIADSQFRDVVKQAIAEEAASSTK